MPYASDFGFSIEGQLPGGVSKAMGHIDDDALIDAYHEGHDAFRNGNGLPYSPGPLADAWKDGKRDAQRDSRRLVVLPERPEGYYHSRLEAE